MYYVMNLVNYQNYACHPTLAMAVCNCYLFSLFVRYFSDCLASASNILPRLGLEQPVSASALPRLDLILSCLALPRPRQFCIGLGLVKTASPTTLLES